MELPAASECKVLHEFCLVGARSKYKGSVCPEGLAHAAVIPV